MASGRKSTSMRTTEGATRRVASRTKAFIFLRGGGVGVGTAGERASASAAWTLRSGMMKDAAGGTGRMREVPVVVVGIGRGSARAKAEGGLHACARAAAPERSAAASLGRHGEAGGGPGPGDTGKPRSAVADAVGRDDASGAGWATPRGARETDGDRRGRPRAAVGIGRRATASLVLISGETTTGKSNNRYFSTRGTDRPTRLRARPYPRTASRVSTRRSRERCARAGDHSHARTADWPPLGGGIPDISRIFASRFSPLLTGTHTNQSSSRTTSYPA